MLYINGTRAQQKWRNGHVPWGLLDRRHMMLILLRQVARTWQEHRCWWTSHRFTFDATCFGFAIPAQGDLIPIFSYNFAVEESSELEKFDFPIADLFSFLQRIFSVCSAFEVRLCLRFGRTACQSASWAMVCASSCYLVLSIEQPTYSRFQKGVFESRIQVSKFVFLITTPITNIHYIFIV